MSGIFGIFHRDGKKVEKSSITSLLKGMSYWEPDDFGTWTEGPIALGHTMLWNTPESTFECLPQETDFLVITMDARLDNRVELADKLDWRRRPIDQTTDSDFILAAYQKWGEDSPKHLLGDFAFAIWDKNKQQLFCARDHVGVKQFYYYKSDTAFFFATDLKALTGQPNVPTKLNDEAVANYLVNHQLRGSKITFFEHIFKLEPAHSIAITKGAFEKTCYWKLEDSPKVRLDDLAAYSSKLRQLLESAVHDRMRSNYPIAAHLSGGLDSSTISVIAARKLRKRNQTLQAYNWLHEPPEEVAEHYEWSNSLSIAQAEGIKHNYVPLSADDLFRQKRDHAIVFGHTVNFGYEFIVRNAVNRHNSRTILSGWGGDEFATYHGQAYYADLLYHGRLVQLFGALLTKARNRTDGSLAKKFASAFYHQVFLVFIPRRLYRHMPKSAYANASSLRFVNESFLPWVKKEQKKSETMTIQPRHTIREHMLDFWESGRIQARIESWANAATSEKLEYSYPLLDKRILEFMAGLPSDCFVQDGVGRYLFRAAASGLLPDEILWSNAKRESNRVKRLAALMVPAFQKLVKADLIEMEKSTHINLDEVIDALESLTTMDTKTETLLMLLNLDTALSAATICKTGLSPQGVESTTY